MKNTSFHLNWLAFFLGFLLAIFGVIPMLFARNDRRDKIYSSLMGLGLSAILNMILLHYGLITIPQ